MKHLFSTFIALGMFSLQAQTEIYFEDFQSGSIPMAYTLIDNDGNTPHAAVSEYTAAWIIKDDPEDNVNKVASSTSYFDPAAEASRWIIPPAITLGGFGNYLKWNAKSHDPSFPDSYLVLVSTIDNQIANFTDTVKVVLAENASWTSREVNLDAYTNQSIYIAIVNNTYDGFKLYIDSIAVRIEDPVGIKELESEQISVYPNPLQQVLYIGSKQSISKLQLTDSKGVLLDEFQNVSEINVSDLPTGVYILHALTARGTISRRIIKN